MISSAMPSGLELPNASLAIRKSNPGVRAPQVWNPCAVNQRQP